MDMEGGANLGVEKKHKKNKGMRCKVSDGNCVMGVSKNDAVVEKKRKKKRHGSVDGIVPESEDVDSETQNILDTLEFYNSDKKIKKKKKTVSEPADTVGSFEVDTASIKKKNKKKAVGEPANAVDSFEIDTGSINKKKKKKDKSTGDASNDVVLEVEVAEDHSVVNKRKKQKLEVSNGLASEDMQAEATNVMQSREVKEDSIAKKKHLKGTSDAIAPEFIQSSGAKDKKKKHTGTDDIKHDSESVVDPSEVDTGSKKKKKHKMAKELPKNSSDHSEEKVDEEQASNKVKKRKRNFDAADSSKKRQSKGKRVSFSDEVEVFPLAEHLKYRKLNSEGDLVQGKRYSPEEDAKIIQAVDDYIIEKGLATNGVDKELDEDWKKARNMIMNCKEHRELIGCWKDISLAIPWRTPDSIYQRAHLIYERADDRKWTKDEINMILNFHVEHGPKWRELGDFLGKSRKHVKDAYRRNKLAGEKKGAWSQEEYQKLFDLVNHDICLKAIQEKKVKHGMLRDNIAWGAISESIGTRASPTCCSKWYYQLCSSMVVEGNWLDSDDYKLVDALYSQDACCTEDVEWDSLLELRSGDLCQRRWAEMSRNLGEHRLKPFLEQVEILHQRYDRDLIEARETYEKKDPVDV